MLKRTLLLFVGLVLLTAFTVACGANGTQDGASGLNPDNPNLRRDQCARDPIPPGWVERCAAMEEPQDTTPDEPEEPEPPPEDSTGHEPEPDPEPEPTPDPGDGTAFYADGFESYADGQSLTGEGDGAFTWGGAAGTVTVSSEMVRSGSRAVKFRLDGPTTQWNIEQRFFLGRQVTEVWLEYYLYHPTGAEGIAGVGKYRHGTDPDGPDNNKFLRIWGADYNDDNKLGFSTREGNFDTDDSRLFAEYQSGGTAIGRYGLPYVTWITDARRGVWVQVRMHLRLDDGRDTGAMEVWLDGAPAYSATGLDQGTAMTPYWDRGYLFGAMNSGSPNNSAIYMDDFRVIDGDPGW